MPDTRVLILNRHAELACDNCGTTQLHDVQIYWNDTTQRLEVRRECKCFVGDSSEKYIEEYKVDLEAEA